MAISLLMPAPLLPVLSPTRQPCGKPARSRVSPVVLATSHWVSCMRDDAFNASPSNRVCMVLVIAIGDVVSRRSPGMPWLRSGSRRSRRVTVSPCVVTNAVSAAGPPQFASSTFAAVLSLTVIAAWQSSAILMPAPPTCRPDIGEYGTRSLLEMTMRRSSASSSLSTRARTCATSIHLNVLHIGNRSSPRWSSRRPLGTSTIDTPSLPPCARSSAAMCAR